MKFKFEFERAKDGGFGYNGVLIGVFWDRELWFQTLPKTEWYFGYQETWYDGPIGMFGIGPVEFLWHYPM